MKANDNDIVHVIITTYNYGQFIEKALESAIHQTYKNIKITVLDDNSKDDTSLKVLPFLKKYKNITYIKNKKNLGMIGNYNKGLALNRYPYLTYLAADDILHHQFIEKTLEKITKYKTGIVFSGEEIIDVKGNKIALNGIQYDSGFCKNSGWFFMEGLRAPAISGILININKANSINLKFFNENYRYCPELDYWLRLSEKYGLFYINTPLFKKRLHQSSDSYIKDNFPRVKQFCDCIYNFLQDHHYLYKHKDLIFNAYMGCVLFALRFNEPDIAFVYFKRLYNFYSLAKIFSFKFLLTCLLLFSPESIRQKIIKWYDRFMLKIPESISLSS